MSYLEEAADLLREAAVVNERKNASYESILIAGRERIAMKFALLGAIERGLLPAELGAMTLDPAAAAGPAGRP